MKNRKIKLICHLLVFSLVATPLGGCSKNDDAESADESIVTEQGLQETMEVTEQAESVETNELHEADEAEEDSSDGSAEEHSESLNDDPGMETSMSQISEEFQTTPSQETPSDEMSSESPSDFGFSFNSFL